MSLTRFQLTELDLDRWKVSDDATRMMLLRDCVLEIIDQEEQLAMRLEENQVLCRARYLSLKEDEPI